MDNQDEILEQMLSHIRNVRGDIIGEAITLEGTLNLFIARHYCNNNKYEVEFLDTMLSTSKITFEGSRDTAFYIIKTYYPGFLERHSFITSTHLQKLLEERNIFAHFPHEISTASIKDFERDKTIRLIKYKGSKTILKYSPSRIMEILKSMNTLSSLILELTP